VKILAVDDEAFNLDIMTYHLEEAGFSVVQADDGDIALQKLATTPDIDVIILDRMMPRMSGMEVLEKIKKVAELKNIPVIMQTAAAATRQILQGIEAGVYYYLTKPYEDIMLVSIIKAALKDTEHMRELRREVLEHYRIMGNLDHACFRFRTLEEAQNLAYFIANCFPDPKSVICGLSEIMTNAVEHGNLGIGYDEKTDLLQKGAWAEEVRKRLALPENLQKYAILTFETGATDIRVTIKDQGDGFDWKNYLEMSPERATDPNGRGIATAITKSFSSVEYRGCGNEVVCISPLKKADSRFTARVA
jgi:DNA-binding response OmpR family regulator/anti-sigma regulatory factor (Ser/Thr protein kinase)